MAFTTYTKQQLQGGGRYIQKVKLGNWLEDQEINSLMLKDFLGRKERGELKLDAYNRKLARGLQPVELSKQGGDGLLRFGDTVMLKSLAGDALACCADDADPRPGINACGASLSPLADPVTRTTFQIVRVEVRAGTLESTIRYDDADTVHYGQKFRLMANPACQPESATAPLFLKSCPVSLNHYAKFSRFQEVSFSQAENYDTVWVLLTPDPAQQLISEGVSVAVGAPVIVQHAATKAPLSAEKHAFTSDFGREAEVAAHLHVGQKHLFVLDADKSGKPSVARSCTDQNIFAFV